MDMDIKIKTERLKVLLFDRIPIWKYCKNIHFLSLLYRSGSNWWWLENRRETSTLLNHQIYWLELFMPFFPGICGVHRVRQCGQLLWCPAVLCWSENCYKIFLSLAVLTRIFLMSFTYLILLHKYPIPFNHR